jgi:hypothetical protein
MRTISLLRSSNVLDPALRIKLSRGAVKQIMLRSILAYPFPAAWKGLVAMERK